MIDPADDPTSIGNILIELGYCTQTDIDRVRNKEMGDLLVAEEVITPTQLEWALVYQKVQRQEATTAETRQFAREQRSQLCAELNTVNDLTLALADKIQNGR